MLRESLNHCGVSNCLINMRLADLLLSSSDAAAAAAAAAEVITHQPRNARALVIVARVAAARFETVTVRESCGM